MSKEVASHSLGHWDAFWRARDKAVAQELAGVRDPAFADFWKQFFTGALRGGQQRVIDIACGNGAVTTVANGVAQATGAQLGVFCVDCSLSAVTELRKRFPHVACVVCDAGSIPCPDRSFDLVVSQFGIEYAGEAAFAEAARLVAGGGCLTAIVHLADSALHRECAENLAAVAAVSRAGLVPLARDAFGAGFELIAGRMSRPAFQQYDKRLAVAVERTKQILRDKGQRALGGFLANLLRDIGHMYTRIQHYAPDKVFAWLDVMASELVSYEGRMASMTECALDHEAMTRIAKDLTVAGLAVEPPGKLLLQESGKPAGWILSARRADQSA